MNIPTQSHSPTQSLTRPTTAPGDQAAYGTLPRLLALAHPTDFPPDPTAQRLWHEIWLIRDSRRSVASDSGPEGTWGVGVGGCCVTVGGGVSVSDTRSAGAGWLLTRVQRGSGVCACGGCLVTTGDAQGQREPGDCSSVCHRAQCACCICCNAPHFVPASADRLPT